MTSGNFEIIPVEWITVNREERQRKDLTDIEELADSIRKNGLIHPIIVTRDYELIAGERRFTAHQYLNFDNIAVQYIDELDPQQLQIIELEENVRRKDLTWQDKTRSIGRFHEIQKEVDPDWTMERTGEHLGFSGKQIKNYLVVNEALQEEIPDVMEAPKFSTALNFTERRNERRKASALRDITQTAQQPLHNDPEEPELPLDLPKTNRFSEIRQEDFLKWSENVLENPFNFIHCDFPYGVNAGDTKGQSAARNIGGYEDKPEIYFNLLDTLLARQDYFLAPSAHMIFWFSMDFYQETYNKLSEAGWTVNIFPLVWHKSDNTGILPDPNRGPRRVYETAFFCYRGGRPVVKAVGNCIGSAVTKEYHMSEKPSAVLEHFFRMIIDETTHMLDPTCGSGNAVKVAEAMGASFSLGLEINEDYVIEARRNLGYED